MKKLLNKKLLLPLIIYSSLTLTACSGTTITQTANTLTTELGSQLEINLSDYFTSNKPEVFSEFLVDTSAVHMDSVGTYNVTVDYQEDRYNISVTVVDTTAPTIKLKDLKTYNEQDNVRIKRITEVDDLSKCSVHFLVDNEKLTWITVSEEATQFEIIAEDIYGNSTIETVTFDVYVNPFKYHVLNPATQCTYDRGADPLDSSDDTYTVSQEFKEALLAAVPVMADFPEAYQENVMKHFAQHGSIYDSETEVIEHAQASFNVNSYYVYDYHEKYGDVKGYRKGTGLALVEKKIHLDEASLEEMTLKEIESLMDNFRGSDYATKEEAQAAFGALSRAYSNAYNKENPDHWKSYYETNGIGGIVTGGDDGSVDESGWFHSSTVTFVYKADRNEYVTLVFHKTGDYDDIGRALYTLEDYHGLVGIIGLEGDQYAVSTIAFDNITANSRGYQGPIKWN